MNFNVGFLGVLVAVSILVQEPADGAPLYRRQDVNSDHYLDSPRGLPTDFDERSEFVSGDISYEMDPDVQRVKDIRNKPTTEEILRQARRERNRVVLGAVSARRPSMENGIDDSAANPRGDTRYSAKYGKTGEDTGTTRSRQNLSPELYYDDSNDGATTSRLRGYSKYDVNRLGNKTPEPVRESYKTTDLKYKLGSVNGHSKPSEEEESYDLLTLSSIIKTLRAEKPALDKTSNVLEDGRRVISFAKEREGAKGRTNYGGLQRTDIKPQGNINLEEYLITTRTNVPNVDQGHKETAIGAKDHVLRLLGELEKLEEMKSLQRGLDAEGDYPQYYELRQELADDLKVIRNKVRQAIRELK